MRKQPAQLERVPTRHPEAQVVQPSEVWHHLTPHQQQQAYHHLIQVCRKLTQPGLEKEAPHEHG